MGKLLSQFFRSGQIQLSRQSHEDRAVGNAHVCNEVCLFRGILFLEGHGLPASRYRANAESNPRVSEIT